MCTFNPKIVSSGSSKKTGTKGLRSCRGTTERTWLRGRKHKTPHWLQRTFHFGSGLTKKGQQSTGSYRLSISSSHNNNLMVLLFIPFLSTLKSPKTRRSKYRFRTKSSGWFCNLVAFVEGSRTFYPAKHSKEPAGHCERAACRPGPTPPGYSSGIRA